MGNVSGTLTPEKRQELKSRYQFQECLIDYGWVAEDVQTDVGEDFTGRIFDEGVQAGLEFHIQLKSTLDIDSHLLPGGRELSYKVDVKKLKNWELHAKPVYFVLWDVIRRFGCWVYVLDAISELDFRRKDWREQKTARIRIPRSNKTDDKGLQRIRAKIAEYYYPSVSKDKGLFIEAQFVFSNTPEGREEANALERVFKKGDPVTVSGENIKKFEYSEWYARVTGAKDVKFTEQGYLYIGPVVDKVPKPFKLDIESATGITVASIPYVDLRVKKEGTEEATLTNEEQQSAFQIEIVVDKLSNRTKSIKFEVAKPGNNLQEMMELIRFFGALKSENMLVFTNHQSKQVSKLDIPSEFSGHSFSPEYINLIEKLCFIQNETGYGLVLSDLEISVKDANAIDDLTTILKTGQLAVRNVSITGLAAKDLFLSLLQGEDTLGKRKFGFDQLDFPISVLGTVISLGPARVVGIGKFDISVEEVERAVAEMGPDDEKEMLVVMESATLDFFNWPQEGKEDN